MSIDISRRKLEKIRDLRIIVKLVCTDRMKGGMGQEIAAVRIACGMTQRELCAKLKRRNNYIQNIASSRQPVGAAELHFIAWACGSTGAELLGRAIQATDK